jgi:hypothetical protein
LAVQLVTESRYFVMLNWERILSVCVVSIFSTTLGLGISTPAMSQLKPEIWGSVGSKDDDISYAGGVKWSGFALEVGTGQEGATGGDFLTFLTFPVVSPYIGVGLYSGDDTVAYSGGLHVSPGGRIFLGAGYHSLRGFNGKLGFKF